jgi:uncharacterized repeat protein (TIGR01451 family)
MDTKATCRTARRWSRPVPGASAVLAVALVAFAAPAAWAQSSNLSITKTDGAATSIPGETVTYTITASNAGPNPVTDAAFGDLFIAPLGNCSWSCAGQNGGVCSLANGSGANANQDVDLPVLGSVVVTATCTIAPSATLSFFNTATITVPQGVTDPDGMNNSATDVNGLDPSADLAISKTDGTATFIPGGSTTYTIVATNNGPSDAAGATVADTFSSSLTCTWTCSGDGGGSCTAAGAGDINDIVNLPAGASVTYTANCDISNPAAVPLANIATVASPANVPDPDEDNNSALDSNEVGAPAAVGAPALNGLGIATAMAGLLLVAARRWRRR